MLSKEEILKNFGKEDLDDAIRVYECMLLAYNKDIPVFTKFFCKPNIWLYFMEKFNSNNFIVNADGAFDECDRRVISFNNIYDMPFPYNIIKITNTSKFNTLSHKDYLGSLMALGIEREKLGDLRVLDDYAVVPVYEEVTEYILSQLITVGKSPVNVEEIFKENLPQSKFLEDVIIIPSLRIDNIVSKLAKVSRTKALDLISANKVLVDYSKVKEKSQEIKYGQRITISGIGKFVIGEIVGSTKSGRYRIIINKFI